MTYFLCAIALPVSAEDAGEAFLTASYPHEKICRSLERASADNGLPVEFLARLIWQESRFDSRAISPKGAQGIAQFMPLTASWRGLTNPFEPGEALSEAAAYLRELHNSFGNLGLAAAAYNAGPRRLSLWLAGKSKLPLETQNYVRIVTGYSVSEWASASPPEWKDTHVPEEIPCEELATLLGAKPGDSKKTSKPSESPAWGPWGVQLGGHWQEGSLLAGFERLRRRYPDIIGERLPLVLRQRGGQGRAARYALRVSENTRRNADQLCGQLRSAGGACLVLKNP